MINKKNHLRFILLRWHKRIGVFLALFAIWMATSGFLLNHVDDFSFLKKSINNSTIRNWYGLTPSTSVFILDKNTQWQNGSINLKTKKSLNCSQLLYFSAATMGNIAICSRDIYLLSEDGNLIDKISSEHDFNSYAKLHKNIFLKQENSIFLLDSEGWTLIEEQKSFDIKDWNSPMTAHYPQLERSRFLQDMHSGRFFGLWGVYFVDFIAVLLFLLAITGLIAFLKRKK